MTRETGNPTPVDNKGGIWHRFSGAYYVSDGPNRVRVTLPNGTFGIFDSVGRWIEGEVYDVDPEMCVWLSISRAKVSHRLSSQTAKSTSEGVDES